MVVQVVVVSVVIVSVVEVVAVLVKDVVVTPAGTRRGRTGWSSLLHW